MQGTWFFAGAIIGFGILILKLKKAGKLACCGSTQSANLMPAANLNAAPLQSQCFVQRPSQFVS